MVMERAASRVPVRRRKEEGLMKELSQEGAELPRERLWFGYLLEAHIKFI